MTTPPHDLPLVARQDLVDQVLDRLLRPDDVREQPKRFIQPGFYGLAGIGKSRLLREIEARVRTVTPYVVAINFDRRQAAYAPGTAWDLVRTLVERLSEIEQGQRGPLQRLRGAGGDPFRECRRIIAQTGAPTHISQTIHDIDSSSVSDVHMSIDTAAQPIPPNLQQAFGQALAGLGKRVKVQRQFGGLKPEPRPLVVILLDTLEAASKPLRDWLPLGLPGLLAGNLHGYHALVVAAGRHALSGLVSVELPPLKDDESVEFLRRYFSHQQAADPRFADPAVQRSLREDTPTRRSIVELAAGIPLLLQLLADLAAQAPARPLVAPEGPIPEGRQARIEYVVEHYIQRLSMEAVDDAELAQRYRLLLYNAAPRRIPNEGLLAALWRDQPGSGYHAGSDYRALWNRLGREAFVREEAGVGLVYHEVVRDGLLSHLKATDQQRWRDLHGRAAAWWQAEQDEAEALYHALQGDYAAAMGRLRSRVLAALDEEDWGLAQALIGTTRELALAPDDQAWIDLFKAELAWGEGNRPLAEQRLARLVALPELPDELAERLARGMEGWFGYDPELEREQVMDWNRQLLEMLLWWAQYESAQEVQAHARWALGEAARMQDRSGDAVDYYQTALVMYREIGDRQGEAITLRSLGQTALMQARSDDALSYLEVALDLCREIGYRLGEANVLRGLGDAAQMKDRSGDAVDHYQTALMVYQEIGDRLGESNAQLGLGDATGMQARYTDALGYFQAVLTVSREIGDRSGEAHALRGLGQTALMQARHAEAEGYYRAALAVYREISDRSGEAHTLWGLGQTNLMQARYAEAVCQYQAALVVFRETGDYLGEAQTLLGLGEAAGMQDRYADALRHCRAALAMFREIGYRRGEAHALRGLAQAAQMQAHYADALRHYQAALALYREIGDRMSEAHTLGGLGQTALMQAHYIDALRNYQAALDVSMEIGHRLGMALALLGLGEASLMQARYADARPYYEQAFKLYLAIGMPQETLRFALYNASAALDQAQRHREVERSQRLMQQAVALARWLLGWAERGYERCDPALSAQYNVHMQALRARLASL